MMSTSHGRPYLQVAANLLATFSAMTALATSDKSIGESSHEPASTEDSVITLARDLEMRLAVNALPKPLRDGATVLVLESTGYIEARKGRNAFTCLVSRRGGNFYPVCFDEEGARTILRAHVARGS